ncbi:MAG: hypothetical protein Q8R33_14805 [Burkholderiales bacterium]|nr:hypothetical protein [Burkholderiales bacterium]
MTRREPESDEIDALLRASRALEDAPEAVIGRAIGLWRAAAPAVAPTPGAVERFVAALRFDSAGTTPLTLGMRAGTSAVRQLLYSASGRDIDLRLSRPDGGDLWRISGQVLGPDAEGTAELTAEGFSARCTWSELCEFHFDAVPAGRFRLLLHSAQWEIEVPGLDFPSAG